MKEKPELSEQQAKPGLVRTLAESLWFPAVFFFGFLLCYVLPFHSPSPHDVRVAVASPTAAAQIDAGLADSAPGAFDIVPAEDAADAREKIRNRDTVAAYAASDNGGTLYLAKVNGSMLESTLTETFTPIAERGGGRLTTHELVPTEHGDATGTGLFYLSMVWNIVPYISVMMMMRAFSLSRRAKVGTLAGAGVFMSVVGYLIARAMDIIPNEPLAMLYGLILTQAVAWTVYGLVPFVRQYIPGVAIILFVLLSIPSSGGAVPHQMVPGFFRFLHPIMPLGNMIDALHGIFYFDNKGLLRPTLVLCGWLLLGAILIAAGALSQRRAERREATAEGAGEEATTAVERPVEDPSFEAPTPHAVSAHGPHHFGSHGPMLHGTVTEEGGAPASGATVTITDAAGHQLARTVTDGRGEYAATGLPEDFTLVLVSAPGRMPAVAQALPRSGRVSQKDFTLAERVPES